MSAERGGEGAPSNPWLQWMKGLGQATPAFEAWESWISGQLERLVRSDTFLGQMGKALEGSFLLKSQADRFLEQSLRQLRLPTTGDLDAVHARLDELERRLDGVIERLDALAGKAPAAPAAPKAPRRRKSAEPTE